MVVIYLTLLIFDNGGLVTYRGASERMFLLAPKFATLLSVFTIIIKVSKDKVQQFYGVLHVLSIPCNSLDMLLMMVVISSCCVALVEWMKTQS